MARLAVISAKGALPVQICKAHPDALPVTLAGVGHDLTGPTCEHRFEHLGALFDDMKAQGVTEVVMAGAMSRPDIDPTALDGFMQANMARLMQAFQQGDDALLRVVIAMFEEQGFTVRGAHEVLPGLTAEAGLLAGPAPSEAHLADAARAKDILNALGPLDVGQGAVVAAGLCLGIETLQGTDALLGFVAETPNHLRRARGVFVKAPKPGQDLRVDMPTIGPNTIESAVKAGLDGIFVAAQRVLIVNRKETLRLANENDVFLYGQDDL